MSRRRWLGLTAFCLSILNGCSGAPPMSSRTSQSNAPLPTSEALAISEVNPEAPPAVVEKSGACSAQRPSMFQPLQVGRGERVVLAKRDQTTIAIVANEDDGSLHTIDLDKRDEIGVTPLPGSPAALLMLSDGRLVVALRDRNEVLVMENAAETTSTFETRCRLHVPSEPVGLASVAGKNGERVVLTSGYGHKLGVFDGKNFDVERWVDLARDPRAVVTAGSFAYVSHTVSGILSRVDLDSGKVDKVNVLSNASSRRAEAEGRVPSMFGNQAFALALNERNRVFAPMVTVDPGEPKMTSAYGSIEFPVKPLVGVIDAIAGTAFDLPAQASGNHQVECLLPRGAAAMGDRLFVTCLGSDELFELDGRAQNPAEFIRRRVQLPRGPMGVAVDGHRAVVMSQFDRVVSLVDTDDSKSSPLLIALSRPEGVVDEAFERGRRIFHDGFDPRISKDGRACANCHPDGREDGFTWSTPDGPRQTISLAGRLPNAAPYGWFGDHVDLQNHLRHTLSRLGGQNFEAKEQADLDGLVAYLSRMKAPVAAVDPASAELVSKGHTLFHAAAQGCGECHAEGGTDRVRHNIGTGRDVETRLSFDTPSLLSIAGSAPYFHDGRYKSLDEILAKADDKMGHAKHLNEADRQAMVAYMESLAPAPAPERGTRTFIRPAAPAVLPAVVMTPMKKLTLRQLPARKTLENVNVDVDGLPVVDVLPTVKYDEKKIEPQGGEIKKLLVWSGECAAVPYHSAAHLMIDWRSTGMSRSVERCVATPDADGTRAWRDVLVQTVDPLPNGRLRVEEHRGYFRVNTHEVWVTNSLAVDAVPLENGLAFAFRTHCGTCEQGQQDKLHVITPANEFPADEYFAWHTLDLDRGRNDSFIGMFNQPNLERWTKSTNVKVVTGGVIGAPKNVVLRVDTSRLMSEDKPHVAAGRATCVEEGFSCR